MLQEEEAIQAVVDRVLAEENAGVTGLAEAKATARQYVSPRRGSSREAREPR